jgi:hypothetical protein
MVMTGPIGDAHPRSINPAVLFSPGLLRTITVDAPPSALVPEERGGDPIDGQVDEDRSVARRVLLHGGSPGT